MMRVRLTAMGVFLSLAAAAFAGPRILSYQGSLLDDAGRPVNGAYEVRFRLFGNASGGAHVWEEIDAGVEVTEGLFSTILGDGTAFSTTEFASDYTVYLEVAVDLNANGTFETDEVYAPRQRVAGAAWAMDADRLTGLWAAAFQRRVTGTAPAGHFITAVNWDGTVVTAPDQVGTGDITAVSAGAGLTGGGTSGDVAIAADTSYVQRRVTGSAPSGEYIRSINADGTVVTGVDQAGSGDITAVSAGAGLTGGGTSGSVALAAAFGDDGTSEAVSRADHTHPGADVISPVSTATLALSALLAPWSGLTGVPAGFADGIDNVGAGDITAVNAGNGLTGGGTSGDVSLAVEFAGTGTANTAARSDHAHPGGTDWSLWGNAGTVPGTNFLGTLDAVPLELHTSSTRILRLEPDAVSPNVVSGHAGNYVHPAAYGGTVGGGGASGFPNRVLAPYGTVGGGHGSRADGELAFVGGGDANAARAMCANVVGGRLNDAASTYSFIGGGYLNAATASYGTIGGGYDNETSGPNSVVGGGLHNTAGGLAATVGGGRENIAGAGHTTVAGGWENTANGDRSTIGGGYMNDALGFHATVGGGMNNDALADYGTVSGGSGNRASGGHSTVGGGHLNYSTGTYATIAGGRQNGASGGDTTVGGGSQNTAIGMQSTVAGGSVNTAVGHRATVGGGQNNTASGIDGAVAGGSDNMASGPGASVGGGYANTAVLHAATVGGGQSNDAIAFYSTVSGGMQNSAEAIYATVAGGNDNHAIGDRSTIAGGRDNSALASDATVGGGTFNLSSGSQATIAGGAGNTASAVNATVGGGAMNTAGAPAATIGGGGSNVTSGTYATIPGGLDNAAAGDYSFAAGRRAKALHQGSFVWADSTDADFASSYTDQFLVRATGGVNFVTSPSAFLVNGMPVGDADSLNTGTLSTDRFSAHADLAAEGYLGDASGDVAQNNTNLQTDLNADRLDGQHGGFYQNADNINAGTVNTDRYSAYTDLGAEGRLDNNEGADLLTRTQSDGRYYRFQWEEIAGTSHQAESNRGYVPTNAGEVVITLPTTPTLGDMVSVNGGGGGSGAYRIAQNAGQVIQVRNLGIPNYSAGWTARESVRDWRSIASSADGTKLVACASSGQIYTSSDSGVSWTARDSNRAWRSVASSADGTYLVACVASGQIYTSSDSGVNWTARESNRNWSGVASSADGSKLAACAWGGQIYTSADYGVTWTPRAFVANWTAMASSADGATLVACVDSGQIQVSLDSGGTWNGYDSPRNWTGVACSGDGTRMVACVVGGQIYTSSDAGLTWTPRESNRSWSGVASSGDGTRLVACVLSGRIYTSSDAGLSWTPRASSRDWGDVCSSEDGTRLAACVTGDPVPPGGQLYTFDSLISETTAGASGYLRAYPKAVVQLQYVGGDTFVPLSALGKFSAR